MESALEPDQLKFIQRAYHTILSPSLRALGPTATQILPHDRFPPQTAETLVPVCQDLGFLQDNGVLLFPGYTLGSVCLQVQTMLGMQPSLGAIQSPSQPPQISQFSQPYESAEPHMEVDERRASTTPRQQPAPQQRVVTSASPSSNSPSPVRATSSGVVTRQPSQRSSARRGTGRQSRTSRKAEDDELDEIESFLASISPHDFADMRLCYESMILPAIDVLGGDSHELPSYKDINLAKEDHSLFIKLLAKYSFIEQRKHEGRSFYRLMASETLQDLSDKVWEAIENFDKESRRSSAATATPEGRGRGGRVKQEASPMKAAGTTATTRRRKSKMPAPSQPCDICGNLGDDSEGGDILVCEGCGIAGHTRCVLDYELQGNDGWVCRACMDKPKRKKRGAAEDDSSPTQSPARSRSTLKPSVTAFPHLFDLRDRDPLVMVRDRWLMPSQSALTGQSKSLLGCWQIPKLESGIVVTPTEFTSWVALLRRYQILSNEDTTTLARNHTVQTVIDSVNEMCAAPEKAKFKTLDAAIKYVLEQAGQPLRLLDIVNAILRDKLCHIGGMRPEGTISSRVTLDKNKILCRPSAGLVGLVGRDDVPGRPIAASSGTLLTHQVKKEEDADEESQEEDSYSADESSRVDMSIDHESAPPTPSSTSVMTMPRAPMPTTPLSSTTPTQQIISTPQPSAIVKLETQPSASGAAGVSQTPTTPEPVAATPTGESAKKRKSGGAASSASKKKKVKEEKSGESEDSGDEKRKKGGSKKKGAGKKAAKSPAATTPSLQQSPLDPAPLVYNVPQSRVFQVSLKGHPETSRSIEVLGGEDANTVRTTIRAALKLPLDQEFLLINSMTGHVVPVTKFLKGSFFVEIVRYSDSEEEEDEDEENEDSKQQVKREKK